LLLPWKLPGIGPEPLPLFACGKLLKLGDEWLAGFMLGF